jgi:hypothetical protein
LTEINTRGPAISMKDGTDPLASFSPLDARSMRLRATNQPTNPNPLLPFDPSQWFAEMAGYCAQRTHRKVGAMIKDIVLALEVGASRDAARDYAISVAAAFNAHLAAIGFDYAPVLPPVDTVSAVPFDILDAEREANRKAASDAIARFEEAARRAAVSVESRLVEASVSGATKVLGAIARTFDLSVVAGRTQIDARLL